ncbi:Protein WAX2 [Hordeum vulgare]|nr:Protein WAX2 [Hordeum vulgare]
MGRGVAARGGGAPQPNPWMGRGLVVARGEGRVARDELCGGGTIGVRRTVHKFNRCTLVLMQNGLHVWLVVDGLTARAQEKATPGTQFVPYSVFPVIGVGNGRVDCVYHNTHALVAPES